MANGDAAGKTSGGASFVVPAGWTRDIDGPVVRLAAPEGDFAVAIVDVAGAHDAKNAAALAWQAFGGSQPSAKLISEESPRNGWDSWWTLGYEAAPGSRSFVQAHALRHGDAWTVLLLTGAMATHERRGGAIATLAQTLTAPGHARESFAGRTPRMMDTAMIAELTRFFADAAAALDIPGASLALVRGDEIAYAGGVGVRALGSEAPVDADTRFRVASCTKSLTTLMLARLVDAGTIDWDDRVQAIMPGFRLADPALAARLRVRDLLSASTGLPRKDFVWAFTFTETTPAARALDVLATIVPTTPFGEAFQYNNLIAAAAGYVGGHAAYPAMDVGAAYDRAMQERVFDPLGMARTTFDAGVAEADDNRAVPHSADVTGATVPVDDELNLATHAIRPSGGAWSSARDMAAYVRAELLHGRLPDGTRYVSEANLIVRRQPVITLGADGAYGIGLFVDSTADIAVVRHGGSTPGYGSDFLIFPDAGVGAVILANADAGGTLAQLFKRRLLELLYDGAPKAAADLAAAIARRDAETGELAKALQVPPPATIADRLAARYTSPDLGTLTVDRADGELRLGFARGHARLAAMRDDPATLVSIEPGLRGIKFTLDDAAPPSIRLSDGQHDYRYEPA